MSRAWMCERLRLSRRQSLALIRQGRGDCVTTDAVLAVLNRARRNVAAPLAAVPDDLATAEELVAAPELAGSGLTPAAILRMTRRENPDNRPPHFRINKQTTRFVKSQFIDWLAGRRAEARRRGRTRFV